MGSEAGVRGNALAPATREDSTRLDGRALLLARATWALLSAWLVALFALGVPNAFARAGVISPETARGLGQLGLGASLPAYYWVATDSLTVLAFSALAVLMVSLRSDDWMVMLASLTLVGTAVLYTDPASEASVPMPLIAVAFGLVEICQVSFVFLFPNGRFVPRWLWILIVPMFVWRPAIWALDYLPGYLASVRTGENYGTLRQDPLDTSIMLCLFAVGIASQVYRYRRVSSPTQRQQTKWLLVGVIGAVVVGAAYVLTVNALGLGETSGTTGLVTRMVGGTARQVGLSLLPVALTLSITRYRLWDIDVIIRRTLVYGVVMGILAVAYFALVFVLQWAFRSLTGVANDLSVVTSTLAIAALFAPVRARVQREVGRRLYRRSYDAEQVVTRFGASLSGDVDLGNLTASLLEVVGEAMQPAHSSLWLALGEQDGGIPAESPSKSKP